MQIQLQIMHYSVLILLLITSCPNLLLAAEEGKNSPRKGCYENLCQKSEGKYPSSKIKQLLKASKQFDIKMDETVIEPHEEISNESVLLRSSVTRQREENLCRSVKRIIFPKFDNEENVTIVNVKGYEQKLSIEICEKESHRCKPDIDVLNYQTSCKQMYINVRLLYVDDKKNKLRFKPFKVPNGCVCVYRKRHF